MLWSATPADNATLVRDTPRQHPATAHFPGGHDGTATCADCASFRQTRSLRRSGRGRCLMWAQLRGMAEAVLADGGWRLHPAIDANTAACKYFNVSA